MSDILKQHIPKEWEYIVFKRPRFSLPAEGQIIALTRFIPQLWADIMYEQLLRDLENANVMLAMLPPIEPPKPRQKKGRPSRYRRAQKRRKRRKRKQ